MSVSGSDSGASDPGATPSLRCAERDRIPHRAKRMAAQQSPAGQHAAAQCTMALHRLHRIFRAGRHKAAGVRQRRRYPALVAPQYELQLPASLSGFRLSARAARPAASRAPLRSPIRANGNCKTYFRGLNTTSIGAFSGWPRKPYRFAHPALDAVTLHRIPQHLAHGEAHPQRIAGLHRAGAPRRRKKTVMFPGELPAACSDTPAENPHVSAGASISETCCWRRRSHSAFGADRRLSDLLRRVPRRLPATPWKTAIHADDAFSQLNRGNQAYTADALASLGAPARQHRPTALGLHARTKSVRL